MIKELHTHILVMANGDVRVVVWKDNIIVEIFESNARNVLNRQLELARENGITDNKFRVRT